MDANFEAEIRRKLKVQSPEKVLRGAPQNRSESTVYVYIRQLKTVYKAGGFGPDLMVDLDWIKDHEQVIATIESLTSRDGKLLKSLTKSNYANPFAILASEEAQTAYSKYMQKMKPTEEELDHSMQRKTPKEVANWIPWSELLEKRADLDKRRAEVSQEGKVRSTRQAASDGPSHPCVLHDAIRTVEK